MKLSLKVPGHNSDYWLVLQCIIWLQFLIGSYKLKGAGYQKEYHFEIIPFGKISRQILQ